MKPTPNSYPTLTEEELRAYQPVPGAPINLKVAGGDIPCLFVGVTKGGTVWVCYSFQNGAYERMRQSFLNHSHSAQAA